MGLIRKIRSVEPARFAVPGVVCGAYPQAGEPRDKVVQRKRIGLRPGQIARHAQSIFLRAIKQADQGTSAAAASARQQLRRDGVTPSACANVLAVAALAVHESLGLRAHGSQFVAAAAMLNQELVEMATGEGKSVAAVMAAATAAMAGSPVHLMTSNDYLAQRDADTFAAVFNKLGISVSCALSIMPGTDRSKAYRADVCYSTAKTIAFDYLRDQRQLATLPGAHLPGGTGPAPRALLRGLCFAIVDEADCVLLDEANMPLILAEQQSDPQARARLWQAIDLARQLSVQTDFTIDQQMRRIRLRAAGERRITELSSSYSSEWLNSRYRRELIIEALNAIHILQRAVDYIVRDGEIVLVDATTGRAVPGRQLPGQLHGLVAVRENLSPPPPTQTNSGLTYPRFFARYHHMAGLSGTLTEARGELSALYGMRVRRVDRHKPSRANYLRCRIFNTRDAQFCAAVQRAGKFADEGRPVLIGTDNVGDSHRLARMFAATQRSVTVLNADNDADEAQRIARSGRAGQITISTQIAGRGTDIAPDGEALANGGLHVLNLQHNRSGRIDRQMTGRAARQGNPGSAEHWLRKRDSPLASDRLTWPVALAVQVACRMNAARAVVVLAQYYWRAEDRSDRSARLRADRKWSQRLHFSSMSDQ